MLGRHVERFEVVVVVFELGALDDEEPEPREDGFDSLAKDGERMAMADARPAARQRDVDRALPGRPRGAVGGQPGSELRLDLLFQLIGELAEPRPLGRRRLTERLEQAETSPPLRAR